jgi:hypothetical protein
VAAGRARGSRPRRVSLPGVAELLRPVGPGPASDSGRQASGREAHPQKITVYLSADELLDLERARLTLRACGIGVDRGRLVREAIAVLLADLEAGIDVSVVARRLRPAGGPGMAIGQPGTVGGVLADAAAATGAMVNGTAVNDTAVNDTAVNGTAVDGTVANGTVANGTVVDITVVDGIAVPGAAAGGAAGDGAGADAAAAGGAAAGPQ